MVQISNEGMTSILLDATENMAGLEVSFPSKGQAYHFRQRAYSARKKAPEDSPIKRIMISMSEHSSGEWRVRLALEDIAGLNITVL